MLGIKIRKKISRKIFRPNMYREKWFDDTFSIGCGGGGIQLPLICFMDWQKRPYIKVIEIIRVNKSLNQGFLIRWLLITPYTVQGRQLCMIYLDKLPLFFGIERERTPANLLTMV